MNGLTSIFGEHVSESDDYSSLLVSDESDQNQFRSSSSVMSFGNILPTVLPCRRDDSMKIPFSIKREPDRIAMPAITYQHEIEQKVDEQFDASESPSAMCSMSSRQFEGEIYYEMSAPMESSVHLEEAETLQNRPKTKKQAG